MFPVLLYSCVILPYESYPDLMVQVIRRQSKALKQPLLSVAELLDKLSKQVPEFASKIRIAQQNTET